MRTVRWIFNLVPVASLIAFTVIHLYLNSYWTARFEEGAPGLRELRDFDASEWETKFEYSLGQGPSSRLVPKGGHLPDRPYFIHEVTSNNMDRKTGPWHWRFFQWGVVSGTKITVGSQSLEDAGVSPGLARTLDVANPTPFVLVLAITIVCLLVRPAKVPAQVKARQEESRAGPVAATATVTLHEAAASGDLATVTALLDQGADVNQRNEDEWTALHCAARRNHVSVVRTLIERGADRSLVDRYGRTAAAIAKSEGFEVVAQLLGHSA